MQEISVFDVDWQLTLKGGHYTVEEVQAAYPLEKVTGVDHIWLRFQRLSESDCQGLDINSDNGRPVNGFLIFEGKKPKGVVAKATGVYLE
jgi:hypothetical protein